MEKTHAADQRPMILRISSRETSEPQSSQQTTRYTFRSSSIKNRHFMSAVAAS